MRLPAFTTHLMLTGGLLAIAGIPVYAQGYYGAPYGRTSAPAYNNYERRGGSVGSALDQTRADLDRAARDSYYLNHRERHHFENAMRDLDKFQAKLSRGEWDNHAIDKVIDNVAHLATADRLRPGDRQMLNNDLFGLREFRNRRGIGVGYGARY